jgi:lysophospholipase L1-like esterase
MLAAGLVAGLAGPAAAATGGARVYLALGDSLAEGVQPDSTGHNQPTKFGYVNDLYRAERARTPGLRLRNMGCSGETTATLIGGGVCPYGQGSQLAQAEHFLELHQGSVAFVTVDVGANDIAGCVHGGTVDPACVQHAFQAVGANLPVILGRLRAAAGPGVPIVGMSYYDPFLAAWLQGPDGQALAKASEQLLEQYNGLIGSIFHAAGSPVADVQSAFSTSDFTDMVTLPGYGQVPRNVARVCEWTWMCAAPPVGPNIHANGPGYLQIAAAFEAALAP